MDMKKEIELIELRAQVSLLFELLLGFELGKSRVSYYTINAILQDKHEQINELEKQIQNETNV
jgi:hypothetical protein